MKRLRKLWRGEEGQVLYLAVAMLMFLAVFSLLVANTMILVSTKVRAQNAADQMALSAATLRARFYNQIVNINGALYAGVQYFGFASYSHTYSSAAQFAASAIIVFGAFIWGVTMAADYQNNIDGRLARIAAENGIEGERARVRIHPVDLAITDFNLDLQPYTVTSYPSFTCPLPDSFDPKPCAVQSRVTWRTSKVLIGGRWLGARLPDVVARARAEIRDVGGPFPFMRDWHVFLVQPTDEDDEYLAGQDAGPVGGATWAPYLQGGFYEPTNPYRPTTGRTGGHADVVLPGGTGGGTSGGRDSGQGSGGQEEHSPRRGAHR